MALFTILSKSKINQVAKSYGLPPPLKFKAVLEGTVNTYYRLTYPDQILYLKIDEIAKIPRLKLELEIFKKLNDLKLPFLVPQVLKTASEKLYVMHGAKPILLFTEVRGKSLLGNKLLPSHLKQIGQALAILHKKTQGLILKPHRFDHQGQRKVFSEIKSLLQVRHPAVANLINEKFRAMGRFHSGELPHGLIHADLFPENILFSKNKLSGILDFEAAGSGAFLFDIGVTLHACCHPGSKFDLPRARAFLKGYESVRPLTKSEKSHLLYYLDESAMRFLLTRLRDFELKSGPVKAKPFKDYSDFVRRFQENASLCESLLPK